MKKMKFDYVELTILSELVMRKLDKLSKKEIDEFSMEYKRNLEEILRKIENMKK